VTDGGRSEGPRLLVVMYHYVRDTAGTAFPGLHAVSPSAFRSQIDALLARYEPATLETALEFWSGRYRPSRDLFLLTFDDGLADHYRVVLPILDALRVQGAFLLPTASIDSGVVLPTHQSHFLSASLGFEEYSRRLRLELGDAFETFGATLDPAAVRAAYRWDVSEVARFKFILNRLIPEPARDLALDRVWQRAFGATPDIRREIYLDWDQAREMQSAGMALGGHTHTHPRLASLSEDAQRDELQRCHRSLARELSPSARPLPFAYPFGKPGTFDARSESLVEACGFACAFATHVGVSRAGQALFAIPRLDPKDVIEVSAA